MIEKVRSEVYKLLCSDDTGHGMDHIERVLKLSLEIASKENANKDVVSLIALLHDVDDYKLVGKDNAIKLSNAKMIMDTAGVSESVQIEVIEAIKTIGYSKRLKGIKPLSLEAKNVSDADMLDALGVNGIIRAYTYSFKNGEVFFDRNAFPKYEVSVEDYTTIGSKSTVNHIFEKILKLKDLMMTKAGKEKALSRHQIVVDFLYHLFDEEDALEWKNYLDQYLGK